jgi:cytosine/adenosine deaminase-related metal-dependent hydrolase
MTDGPVLLSAGWVVGHAEGRHKLYRDGEIVIEKDRVVFVGHSYPGEIAQRIDYGHALIGPGFVDLDALSDLDTTVLAFDNQPAWKKGRVWPQTYMDRGPFEMYGAEELAFQKRYAFTRLIRGGITTALPIASLFYRAWGETVSEFEAAAEAARALGLRVYLGPAYRTGNAVVQSDGSITMHFDEERGLRGLADAIALCRRMDGTQDGLVRAMLAPDRIETCTAELLRQTRAAADELGVPVRLHSNQSRFEFETVVRLHGKTPTQLMSDLGLLSPRALLPHGLFISGHNCIPSHARDLDMLSGSDATIVHCPLVFARSGTALRSFRTYRDKGIRIGLGTDTYPPDMFENMRLGMMLCRVVEGSPTACRSEEFYDAATIGGADALGRPDLGRLQPGAKADLMVVDFDNPFAGQVIDPIQTLMLNGAAHMVRSVMIDGKFVMQDGAIPGVDSIDFHQKAQAQFDRLVSQYPQRTLGHPPVEDIFSSSYAIIARPS